MNKLAVTALDPHQLQDAQSWMGVDELISEVLRFGVPLYSAVWIPHEKVLSELLKLGRFDGPGRGLTWTSPLVQDQDAFDYESSTSLVGRPCERCPDFVDTVDKWKLWRRVNGSVENFHKGWPLVQREAEIQKDVEAAKKVHDYQLVAKLSAEAIDVSIALVRIYKGGA